MLTKICIPNLCDCMPFRSFRYIKQPKTMSKEKKKQTSIYHYMLLNWDPLGIQLSHPDLGPTTLVWVRPMDPMDRAPDLVGRQAPTTLPRFMAALRFTGLDDVFLTTRSGGQKS